MKERELLSRNVHLCGKADGGQIGIASPRPEKATAYRNGDRADDGYWR